MSASAPTDELVRATLNTVADPCSIAANARLGLSDMGMVRRWTYEESTGHLHLTLCVTTPGCTMVAIFAPQAEEALLKLAGVRSVEVEIERSGFWTEADISDSGRAMLAQRRARPRGRAQAWREAKTPAQHG